MTEEQDNGSLPPNTIRDIHSSSKEQSAHLGENVDTNHADSTPHTPIPPRIPENPPHPPPQPAIEEPSKQPPPKKDRASKAREVLAQKRAKSTLENLYKKQREIEAKLAKSENYVPPVPIRIEITNPEGNVQEIIIPKPVLIPTEKETPIPTIPTAPMSSEDEFEVRKVEGQDEVAVETKKEKNGGKKRKREEPTPKEKKSARKSKSKNTQSEEDEENRDDFERDQDNGRSRSKQNPRKKPRLAPVLVESDEEDEPIANREGVFETGYNMARDNIRKLNIGGAVVDYSKSAATTLAWALFLSGVYYMRARIESKLAVYQAQLLANSNNGVSVNPPQNRPVDNSPAPDIYRKLEPAYTPSPVNAYKPSPFQQNTTTNAFMYPAAYIPSPNHQ
jgi:hypothetical protein